jgi:hypothetical protein
VNRFNEEAYYPGQGASHRSMSADGQYIFFQSADGLTPEAVDQKAVGVVEGGELAGQPLYVMNVYEYHDGVVSLISDGRDITHTPSNSNVSLLGSDESGADVFFDTADQLAPQDTDDNIDIYDARVDGGFPAPPTPLECSGEACQGQLSAAPTLLSPGSQFQAGGNPPLAGVAEPAPKPKGKTAKPKKRHKSAKGKRGKHAKKRHLKTVRGKRARANAKQGGRR